MNFIQHTTNNHVLGVPKEWDHSQGYCSALPCTVSKDEEGLYQIQSFWKPTKEELDAIVAGRPIMLTCIGGQPPVRVEVAATD